MQEQEGARTSFAFSLMKESSPVIPQPQKVLREILTMMIVHFAT
jgi:hypothetical protein